MQVDDEDGDGFKLSLHSIANTKGKNTDRGDDWQMNLSNEIKEFNDLYSSKKQSLLAKLSSVETFDDRKPILDEFFSSIESKSKEVRAS